MDIISVIIPVYNVEKYLRRCLESIINQTYMNLEIIIVNDGSLDSSLQICKEYQSVDKRIIIIDKVNEGVSVARNTGINAASGKYIAFVDPDDWIEFNMYQNMYNTIEKHKCNIAFCNYYKDSKYSSSIKLLNIKKDVLGKLDIINELIGNMIGIEDILPRYRYVMGCVWRCLYLKEFLDNNNLRFTPGITIMEDLIFNIEALIYTDKVCIDQGIYYHYVKNKKSVLHSYNEKMWQDQIMVYNILEKLLKDADLDEYMRNRLDLRYIAMAACAFGNEVYMSDANLKGKIEAAKYIIKDSNFKDVLNRAKKYNIENIKDLGNKQEKENVERENTVIKNLLKFVNHSTEE